MSRGQTLVSSLIRYDYLAKVRTCSTGEDLQNLFHSLRLSTTSRSSLAPIIAPTSDGPSCGREDYHGGSFSPSPMLHDASSNAGIGFFFSAATFAYGRCRCRNVQLYSIGRSCEGRFDSVEKHRHSATGISTRTSFHLLFSGYLGHRAASPDSGSQTGRV